MAPTSPKLPDTLSVEVRRGVIEEYFVHGQHFTRSIQITAAGGFCSQIFAVDEEEIAEEQVWLARLQNARATASHPAEPA